MTAVVSRFTLAVPFAQLTDLSERLDRTRWPEEEPVDDWSQGIPLRVVRDLCDYWAHRYNWRERERKLNAIPQFRTEIDGLGVHFVHMPSPHENALPLVLTHGWPGSVVEFRRVLAPLVDPTAFGGRADDAFHVVCPSLPGFGFSDKPAATGWNVARTARAWAELMTRLGYPRFGAAGSDWGTSVSASLGQQFADRVVGLHLVPPLAAADPATLDELTEPEARALTDLDRANERESGYSGIQSTKPQTIGYGLVDSPSALCAWILEKFWAWSDHDGDLYDLISRDDLLDNLMLYWLPGTGASAARQYWESFDEIWHVFNDAVPDRIGVPVGASIYPRETPRPSRRWAERRFSQILYWNELDRGGHFAALEQPEVFVRELAAFFRLVRE